MISTYIIVAAVAYLLGSIPFGYILMRLFRGEDVRATGSGNIGATNVARSAPGLGLLTLVLDAGKGFAAVAVSHRLAPTVFPWFPEAVYWSRWSDLACGWQPSVAFRVYFPAALAALCAILGHMFPIWLKFKGGKGVATGVGSLAAVVPKAMLVAILIFAVLVALFRYVSLGSIAAAAALPVIVWLFNVHPIRPPWTPCPPAVLGLIAASSALIILKHHQNIRRLLAGTEHRFSLKGKGA